MNRAIADRLSLKPVAHHRQPDGVLKRVVVVLERLLRVERGSR